MSTDAYDSACREHEASFNETLSKYHMEAAHDMADVVANKLPPYIWDKQDLQPGLDGVMVVGLQSNSELNGSMGVIEGGAPNSRIAVRVFPLADAGAETLLSLAPKNVRTAVAIQEAHKLLASETRTYIPHGFGAFCRQDIQDCNITCNQLLHSMACLQQHNSAIASYVRAWLMCDGLARPGKLAVSPHGVFAVSHDESHELSTDELDPHPGALAARSLILTVLAPVIMPARAHILEPEIAAFAISRLTDKQLAELDVHLLPLVTDADFHQMHRKYTGMDHWRATGTEGSCRARNYQAAVEGDCRFCLHMLMQRGFDYLSFIDGGLLRCASMLCRPVMVAFALLHGTKANHTDIGGCTALHCLANSKSTSAGTQGRQYDTSTAHLLVARLLQIAGADLEAVDPYGCTPLYAAVAVGNLHTATALLALGANAEVDPTHTTVDTPMPLLSDFCRRVLEIGTPAAAPNATAATAQKVLDAISLHEQPTHITIGKRVRLTGLNATSLNGKHGSYVGSDAGSGRLMIQLDTARPPIKVKPENIFPLDDWNQANPSPRNTFDFVTQRALAQGAIDEARLDELTDSIASGVYSETEAIKELCALLYI